MLIIFVFCSIIKLTSNMYTLNEAIKLDKFRDPIHGFIEVSEGESKIINSAPFQRLRNIKQLAMTYFVFHGAEHTRFGHSLGVMHLVTKAFRAALSNGEYQFSAEKKKYYEQILRLIALTHDLGHAPFSHASEAVFPSGLEHEHFTEKIIMETCIGEYINEIGHKFVEEYGEDYNITPELICDIYRGRQPGPNCEYTFLKSFMDSELDCDKMDYLLRDSKFCGVEYGNYDVERLLTSLTIFTQDGCPRLAINSGGVPVFEEFVLARYYMFIQVYFHRTRRYFDMIFCDALKSILPNGQYPSDVNEYIDWDDCKVLQKIKENVENNEACMNIIQRNVCTCVYETKPHISSGDKNEIKLIVRELKKKFGEDNFLEDYSAGKMPHKIPIKSEVGDERAIVIIHKTTGKQATISEESHIIRTLTDKIDIRRLYVKSCVRDDAKKYVKEIYKEIQ